MLSSLVFRFSRHFFKYVHDKKPRNALFRACMSRKAALVFSLHALVWNAPSNSAIGRTDSCKRHGTEASRSARESARLHRMSGPTAGQHERWGQFPPGRHCLSSGRHEGEEALNQGARPRPTKAGAWPTSAPSLDARAFRSLPAGRKESPRQPMDRPAQGSASHTEPAKRLRRACASQGPLYIYIKTAFHASKGDTA